MLDGDFTHDGLERDLLALLYVPLFKFSLYPIVCKVFHDDGLFKHRRFFKYLFKHLRFYSNDHRLWCKLCPDTCIVSPDGVDVLCFLFHT